MLNEIWRSVIYSLFLVLKSFEHLLIPAICIITIVILYKEKIVNKNFSKITLILLLFLTVCSYSVGLFVDSKINNESISIPEKENCFYINSEDNTFSYNGKIFIYKNNRIPSDYINVFADQELFHKDISSIGKFIINNNIGFKIENTNGYKITYSPLVLCEDSFFVCRNNYAGYIIIENEGTMIYIPYNLYFNEKLYNNLTYTQVYSDEYQISVSDIMNSVVTQEQYSTNFYS